jgi:hypothetical protein
MSFSTKRSVYSITPRLSSQSAICRFAVPSRGYIVAQLRYGTRATGRPGRGTRSSGDGEVRFIRPGEAVPEGSVRLTKGEYERSLDGSLVFNSGPNRGKAIGPHEYARRKVAMRVTHPPRLD